MRRRYRDRDGVLRHAGTRRRVRSDYGTVRPHRHGCAHCAMVVAWWVQTEAEHARCGGWRNETFRPSVSFGRWLTTYYREQRAA
jgi:hypothetical protein